MLLCGTQTLRRGEGEIHAAQEFARGRRCLPPPAHTEEDEAEAFTLEGCHLMREIPIERAGHISDVQGHGVLAPQGLHIASRVARPITETAAVELAEGPDQRRASIAAVSVAPCCVLAVHANGCDGEVLAQFPRPLPPQPSEGQAREVRVLPAGAAQDYAPIPRSDEAQCVAVHPVLTLGQDVLACVVPPEAPSPQHLEHIRVGNCLAVRFLQDRLGQAVRYAPAPLENLLLPRAWANGRPPGPLGQIFCCVHPAQCRAQGRLLENGAVGKPRVEQPPPLRIVVPAPRL
mmetsp:Transcript_74615/g.165005  ORF Transcript_74615/g.165005 Transcript_74615/m.165005 type:complete len:289 (-) Transcript_74615:366-1232(-)